MMPSQHLAIRALALLALALAGCLPATLSPPAATLSRAPSVAPATITPALAPSAPPQPTATPQPVSTPSSIEDIVYSGDRWFSFCQLLTLREVEAHTGLAPDASPFENALYYTLQEVDANVTGCNYWPSLALGLYFPGPQEDLRATFEANLGEPSEPVEGLGQAAYWEPESGILDVLRAEGYWLRLQVYGPDFQPGALEAARPLAELAIDRLPDLMLGPAPTPYPALAACDVLTEEEAEAILGPLSEPPRQESAVGEDVGIVDSCVYTGERGLAWLSYRRVQPAENAEYAFKAAVPPDAETISGLGDEATWSSAQGALSVRRGGLLLSVVASAMEGDASEQARAVAQAALGRIP